MNALWISLEIKGTKSFLMEIFLWPKVTVSFPAVKGCEDVFSVAVHVFLMNCLGSEALTALVWV